VATEQQLTRTPEVHQEFYRQLVDCLPHLRAFARVLCRQHDLVDDLVQDSVVRALAAAHQFQPGTNFKAWMFTILRNQNITMFRRQRIPPASLDEVEQEVYHAPPQEDALMMEDLDHAVRQLSPLRREALILVVVHGLSYEEAAAVCRCAVGTIKSRVARARAELHEMLLGDETPDGKVSAKSAAASERFRERRMRDRGKACAASTTNVPPGTPQEIAAIHAAWIIERQGIASGRPATTVRSVSSAG
jgi:RNA polymerase sigma-70 factor, ECF subfamily